MTFWLFSNVLKDDRDNDCCTEACGEDSERNTDEVHLLISHRHTHSFSFFARCALSAVSRSGAARTCVRTFICNECGTDLLLQRQSGVGCGA